MGLPVFDPSVLERLAQQARRHGDMDLVRDLLEEAMSSIRHCTRELETAIGARDLAGLRAHAHRVKSVLRQVGALRMAYAATDTEAFATHGDERAWDTAHGVVAARDETLRALEEHLETLR